VSESATWTVRSSNGTTVSKLAEALDLSPIATKCLINRGIEEADQARSFLAPNLADLTVPDKMADLDLAANRLADAVQNKEKIAIFGDYDVDGVSSASLITTFLKKIGAETETLLADRFSGYGMIPSAIDHFCSVGCGVIVAVDCGTSDHDAAKRASDAGIDLIVVDHHRIVGDFPNVYAFVNPQREDCGFGDTTFAAVGLVFYFVAAIRTILCGRGYLRREDLDLRPFLDLVALGTVADVMPIRGNNRILVLHGLRQMSKVPREGIRSLLKTARIRSSFIRADHIAYQLAPRLNAAGRLGEAREAFELLVTEGGGRSQKIATRLDQLSQERRVLEVDMLEAAKTQVTQSDVRNMQVIVAAGDGWHRGVLGIVAARIMEWSGKPSFIVGFNGDVGIGSARARGQINLHECLSSVSSSLVRFGGHREAAGFAVERENLEALKRGISAYTKANWVDIGVGEIVCDASINATDITASLLHEIERIGPFGSGNPEPIFDVDGLYVLNKKVVGKEHLKLELKTPSGSISAFGPRMGEYVDVIPPLIRVAANLTPDDWRGGGIPELRLVAAPIPGTY
jgi:single-stranded-DNA-specific exonuclease